MITSLTRSLVSSKQWYRSMLAGNDAYNPGSYELISTAYGTGSSSTITFSNIPQEYKHLELRWVARQADASWETIAIYTNNVGNTKGHTLYGSGSEIISEIQYYPDQVFWSSVTSGATANSHAAGIATFLDYTSTTKNKTMRIFAGRHAPSVDGNGIGLSSKFLDSTSAITRIDIAGWNGSNFASTSRFSLYGIKG